MATSPDLCQPLSSFFYTCQFVWVFERGDGHHSGRAWVVGYGEQPRPTLSDRRALVSMAFAIGYAGGNVISAHLNDSDASTDSRDHRDFLIT